MKEVTLKSIMQKGYAAFEKCHALPGYIRDAVSAIVACRTSILGGHIQGCPEGHFTRQWYNLCKHRMFPECAWIQIERWLVKQKARLLACDYYHTIFTIPHELNDLWLANVKPMTDILFTTVRDTLFELFDDDKYLGARPGIIASLHTWSQTLILHAHIHCLITGGGLGLDGLWRPITNGFLLPARVVMSKFRGKLLDRIDKALERGKLKLPKGMSLQKWKNLNNRLGRIKWNVRIKERYSHGEGILIYLAQYIRGGSISNNRLTSCEDSKVTFLYRVKEDAPGNKKRDTMTLPISQFIQRYLLHVPEPNTKVVRYYGLYAPTQKADLDICRKQLNQEPLFDTEFLDWQTYCKERGEQHPELCPICGKRLIMISVISHSKSTFLPSKVPIKEAA